MTRRKWIALVVLVAIGIGLLVAVVAIPWGDDAPAEKATPVYHQGDSIDVAVGEEFVVALPATPSTGYAWTAAGNPDVTFVSTRQVAGGIAARRRRHPGDDLHRPAGGRVAARVHVRPVVREDGSHRPRPRSSR